MISSRIKVCEILQGHKFKRNPGEVLIDQSFRNHLSVVLRQDNTQMILKTPAFVGSVGWQ